MAASFQKLQALIIHTTGDSTLKEEEVKAGKEMVLAMYKAVKGLPYSKS